MLLLLYKVRRLLLLPLVSAPYDSFTERIYADIAQSEVYTGMKVNTLGCSIPATGLVTADFGFVGKDAASQTGTIPRISLPTAQTSTGIFAAVNGALLVNGTPVA